MTTYAGIDAGGTLIKIAYVDEDSERETTAQRQAPTAWQEGAEASAPSPKLLKFPTSRIEEAATWIAAHLPPGSRRICRPARGSAVPAGRRRGCAACCRSMRTSRMCRNSKQRPKAPSGFWRQRAAAPAAGLPAARQAKAPRPAQQRRTALPPVAGPNASCSSTSAPGRRSM
ncbi:hypothetical protein SABR111722_19010 [Saccharibacillus brassicae]